MEIDPPPRYKVTPLRRMASAKRSAPKSIQYAQGTPSARPACCKGVHAGGEQEQRHGSIMAMPRR
jgi:hypothetical protein